MATFPRTEPEIVALVTRMMAGYSAHVADFPNAHPLALITIYGNYSGAKDAQTDAQATAQVATEAKDAALEALTELMTTQLKQSEVDTKDDPEKLEFIGWGPKSAPHPADVPGQPRNLETVVQGPGILFLDWKSPARGSGGSVRTYVIERQEQPEGGGEFGPWAQISIAIESEVTLGGQPRGPQLEFRVKAVNTGGESIPSNTVAVVL